MPFQEYEPDPNRLVWSPEAKGLWKVIIDDKPLPKKYKEDVISADKPPGRYAVRLGSARARRPDRLGLGLALAAPRRPMAVTSSRRTPTGCVPERELVNRPAARYLLVPAWMVPSTTQMPAM